VTEAHRCCLVVPGWKPTYDLLIASLVCYRLHQRALYGSTALNTLSVKKKKRFSDWKRDFAERVVFNVAVPGIEELAATA